MLVEAELDPDFTFEKEDFVTKRLHKFFHLNSKKLLEFFIRYVEAHGEIDISNEEEKLMENMFYYSLFQAVPEKEGYASVQQGLQHIFSNDQMRDEIINVLKFNYQSIKTIEIDHDFDFVTPLTVHSTYSTEQILAALGYYNEDKRPQFQEGVKYFKDKKLDIFFTTLNKSEKDISPSTMYEDYAINEKLFHWQSQTKVSEDTPTAQRYIHHRKNGNKIAIFVREYKREKGYTAPFIFLGTCEYVSHYGNNPV